MSVKKTAAKKTVAKKGMQNINKQSVAAKKKVASNKEEAKPESQLDRLAENLVNAIKGGSLDGYLGDIDDALTGRMETRDSENKKAIAEKKSAPKEEKKVSTPPKRKSSLKPVAGTKYKVSASNKNVGGATVLFQRFKVDNEDKSVVEMVTEKPGYPKGKRVVLPTSLLEEMPAAKSPGKKPAGKKKK